MMRKLGDVMRVFAWCLDPEREPHNRRHPAPAPSCAGEGGERHRRPFLSISTSLVVDHRSHGALTGDATASRPRMRSWICWKLRS
jgi:hypothetical protein